MANAIPTDTLCAAPPPLADELENAYKAVFRGTVFDAENRLVSAQTLTNLPSSVPRKRVEFTYDYMSRRVGKTVSSWVSNAWATVETRANVFNGWDLLSEICNVQSQITTNLYVWGLDLSGSLQGAGGIGGLLSARLGTNNVCYTFDANGNVSDLVDSQSGSIAAHYEYSPFGETVVATGPLAKANPFRFSTKYTDDEIAMLYYGYRFYSPGFGRFLSKDPIGEEFVVRQLMRGNPLLAQSRLNRVSSQTQPYVFVFNDPQDKFDPHGLWPWTKYTEEGQTNGSVKITIKQPCVIVVLFGHGLASKPHSFVFEKPYTAGGFVGCDAGSTNTKIPGENQIDNLKLTDGDLVLGIEAKEYPDEEKFTYWLNKAKEGAKSKAKSICKDKSSCCKKVLIYGELAGSAWDEENWRQPAGWSETIKCDEVQ